MAPKASDAIGFDVSDGSKPEKLNASICFPLFTQQRTSPRYFGMCVSCQMLTLGAGVSGGPSIRISLMSTGPSKRGKPSPHTPKN